MGHLNTDVPQSYLHLKYSLETESRIILLFNKDSAEKTASHLTNGGLLSAHYQLNHLGVGLITKESAEETAKSYF